MSRAETQFKSGNAGRRKGSRNKATRYRAALDDALTEERELELWRALVSMAIGGDVPAARLIMEYRYGKPRQEIEVQAAYGLQNLVFNVVATKASGDVEGTHQITQAEKTGGDDEAREAALDEAMDESAETVDSDDDDDFDDDDDGFHSMVI